MKTVGDNHKCVLLYSVCKLKKILQEHPLFEILTVGQPPTIDSPQIPTQILLTYLPHAPLLGLINII